MRSLLMTQENTSAAGTRRTPVHTRVCYSRTRAPTSKPCTTLISQPGASTHCFVVMGPLSSMGSPMTFMILPRVSGPTGMRMGAPESSTFCPLTRPSVPSMAIVRTVFSPAKAQGQCHSGALELTLGTAAGGFPRPSQGNSLLGGGPRGAAGPRDKIAQGKTEPRPHSNCIPAGQGPPAAIFFLLRLKSVASASSGERKSSRRIITGGPPPTLCSPSAAHAHPGAEPPPAPAGSPCPAPQGR